MKSTIPSPWSQFESAQSYAIHIFPGNIRAHTSPRLPTVAYKHRIVREFINHFEIKIHIECLLFTPFEMPFVHWIEQSIDSTFHQIKTDGIHLMMKIANWIVHFYFQIEHIIAQSRCYFSISASSWKRNCNANSPHRWTNSRQTDPSHKRHHIHNDE